MVPRKRLSVYDRLRFMLLGCIAALLGMAADHCTGANPPKPVPKREMRETASPHRAEVQRVRLFAGKCDEILHAARG